MITNLNVDSMSGNDVEYHCDSHKIFISSVLQR